MMVVMGACALNDYASCLICVLAVVYIESYHIAYAYLHHSFQSNVRANSSSVKASCFAASI
eukprot:m.12150 g.12150  ORF g.12150 m.12150 type:complete len:61 (-) comp3958_c0_seq1:970-1152(-)